MAEIQLAEFVNPTDVPPVLYNPGPKGEGIPGHEPEVLQTRGRFASLGEGSILLAGWGNFDPESDTYISDYVNSEIDLGHMPKR